MFERDLMPLDNAGNLGVVVFQSPSSLMPRRESDAQIEECCKERLPQYNLSVEFRNYYWLEGERLEETLGFLRHHQISYVAVEEPQGFKSGVPSLADVTGPYSIVRSHGRNRETWEKKGLTSASERFDYYYTPQKLEEWVPRIGLMRENASEVHVAMNTNNGDQRIVNARPLGEILGEDLRVE